VLGSIPVVWDYDTPDGTICSACGKHSEDVDGFCFSCNGQKTLGSKLPDAACVNFTDSRGDYELLPGVFVTLLDKGEEPLSGNVFALSPNPCFPTWRLNTHVPENKTFEEIAENSVTNGLGKAFLAYVKIDVDNLGRIFEEGFKTDSFTISRYVSLSRNLHYFFNSFTRHLLETKYPDAYTVLSGGDDVFIILPWNQAVYLVRDLEKAFKLYCCNNETFHFSAGISVARNKEPFAIVNQRASQALDSFAKAVPGKNAVSYFDVTMKPDELSSFISEYERFYSFISLNPADEKPLSSSFVYRLFGYVCDAFYQQTEIGSKTGMAKKLSAQANLRYDIARNVLTKESLRQCDKDAVNYLLERFNNYRSEKELALFKTLLIHTMYNVRKE
jgi:Predicted hydrolase of the HD superfamily (permuted catalytic motifs)